MDTDKILMHWTLTLMDVWWLTLWTHGLMQVPLQGTSDLLRNYASYYSL